MKVNCVYLIDMLNINNEVSTTDLITNISILALISENCLPLATAATITKKKIFQCSPLLESVLYDQKGCHRGDSKDANPGAQHFLYLVVAVPNNERICKSKLSHYHALLQQRSSRLRKPVRGDYNGVVII